MKTMKSDSGRTTVEVEFGDEGALTVVVERDGHHINRVDLQKEERPVDLRKTRPGRV